MSLTFMAKPNAARGQLLPHPLLAARRRRPLGDARRRAGAACPRPGERVLAGLLATMREFSLLYAPNINSYKRYQPGSFAPTALRWGVDNRTCALRLVGHGQSLRVENRVPGRRRQPVPGDRRADRRRAARHRATSWSWSRRSPATPTTTTTAPRVPGDAARRAGAVGGAATVARAAFGDEVVAHYANTARVELAAFDAAVTDWELFRGFERL